MTFLKTCLRLARPVNEKDFPKFGRLATVYGLRGLAVEGDELVVDYDASRLHEAEVLAAVRKAGLPVAPAAPIPSGAFDGTGEFKDFAWPTTGLSPANQPRK
jgi:hypothetical protein